MRLFLDAASQVDDAFMARAVSLAVQARGHTSPNPVVGCVIVKDGRVIGEGHHVRAGEPHAEVVALAQAGADARDATAYVTLEPCAHHGRTPPCADALVAAGIARVVVGMRDPDSVAQGGADRLIAAGVRVDFNANDAPFRVINEGWVHRVRTGRPLVTVKLAQSLDARLGLHPGLRSDMTGPAGRAVTQDIRRGCDAVLVGARTVMIDDPSLLRTESDGRPCREQPLRVVVSGSTLPPATARVFTDGRARTLVAVRMDASEAVELEASALARTCKQVEIVRVNPAGYLDEVLCELGRHGVGELLVEPGPTLFGGLWDACAIDRIVTVTRGDIAGASAPSLHPSAVDIQRSALATRFAPLETGIVGDVAVVQWTSEPLQATRAHPSAGYDAATEVGVT